MTAQAGSITSPAWDPERRQLRRDLRAQRRALPAAVRAAADHAILSSIKALPEYRRARRVAVFLAFDGEPSLAPLVAAARRQRKKLYVPVVRGMTMTFADRGGRTELTWRMLHDSAEECARVKLLVAGATEENFDRLEAHLGGRP